MIVLLLGALIAAVGIPIAREAYSDLEDADFSKLLELIITTGRSNYEQSTSYVGITKDEIVPNLPQKWILNGTDIRHPLNGTITVAADATDNTRMRLVVSVLRPDTCRRVILTSWPLIDAIAVSNSVLGTGTTDVKTVVGQTMPSEATLTTVCTINTRSVVLLSD
ncbi:hypothetical protein [Ahniella affigens]|nr:hypothetical protein [Ahniella affigens]